MKASHPRQHLLITWPHILNRTTRHVCDYSDSWVTEDSECGCGALALHREPCVHLWVARISPDAHRGSALELSCTHIPGKLSDRHTVGALLFLICHLNLVTERWKWCKQLHQFCISAKVIVLKSILICSRAWYVSETFLYLHRSIPI